MKRIILNYILAGLLLIGIVFLLIRCTEEIISPQKEGSKVTIHITGKKLNICKGDTVITKASYAKFSVLNKNGTNLDTLFNGVLDANGIFDSVYSIKLLGIPNVQVHGLLDLRTAIDSIPYMCCDTSFLLKFNYKCDEIEQVKIGCNNLDTVITLNITNLLGGKLQLGSTLKDIKGNIFQLNPSSNLIIDINNAKALSNNFTLVSVSPNPASDGTVKVDPSTKPFVIEFTVKTNAVGKFTQSVDLPVTCIDELNNTHKGTIKIILNAEIIEDKCTCPFSSGNGSVKEFYPLSASIQLGSTSAIYTNEIFNTNEFTLGENCYLSVESVDRYNSPVPATTLEQGGIEHEWVIKPQNYPVELRKGVTSFSLSASFTPNKVGESTDTFNIHIAVRNSNGEIKETCNYLVSYTGDCCNQNICPTLVKLNNLPADLIDGTTGTVIKGLANLDEIEMGTGNKIKQTMAGCLGTLCSQFAGDVQTATYRISLPKTDSIVPCSKVTVAINKQQNGATDDTHYFTLINSSITLGEGENSAFSIAFTPPDIRTHISTGHSNLYMALVTIVVTDNSGDICSQQMNIVANVSDKNYKISKSTNMKAFSQVSSNESEPSYAAYKIDYYDQEYQYYGKQDKLDPATGTVNIYSTPPSPFTDHSLYFEVDDPTNLTLLQNPKLYLVNTSMNKFSMITAQPVARYNSNSAFHNDLDLLIQEIFKSSFQSRGEAPYTSFNFTATGDPMGLDHSVSASSISGPGKGLTIKAGEVYVVWNPSGKEESFTSGGKTYSNYCDVALLFIEQVSNGSDALHSIGNVSFYVVYPLTTIIQ